MKQSQSVFVPVRGINYHCRIWGNEGAPKLFMLHGFQDVSASWQYTEDALNEEWLKCFPDPLDRPARHTMVSDLPGGMLMQIEIVAVITN